MVVNAPRTRMSARERRQRILDVAVELFASGGYDAVSVGEIAAAADVTKPVLYDHFASKRDLFVELMETIRDELTARSAETMRADAPLEERVRRTIDAFFAYVEARPGAAQVLFVIPRGAPELVDEMRRVQDEATAALTALLASEPRLLAGARDRRRRIELITEFLKQGMHGLAEWWSRNPAVPRRVVVDAAVGIAWPAVRSQLR
jgi:AcrR family transcriptional regulator